MAVPEDMPQHAGQTGDAWLAAFHAGDRACLGACYEDHFDLVERAVGAILRGADRENVVHEVFFRLLDDVGLRASFRGGAFPAWLRVVARNEAIDYARKRRPEVALPDAGAVPDADGGLEGRLEQRTHARLTLERFRQPVLPRKWERVFVARFVEQRDQPEAARVLGMRRTTLAYQEYRVRRLLQRFVLRGEKGS
jgi:RNA polymerase sigma-70 factor (ECF subfamily)